VKHFEPDGIASGTSPLLQPERNMAVNEGS
jgi:hypothetical protein